MEILGLIWIPDFMLWLLLIVVLLYIYGSWPFSTLSSLGYRGPKPSKFTGNMDKVFLSGEHFGSYDLKGKKIYGKVFALYEGRQPTIVCFDTDILKQVLVKNYNNFIDRRPLFMRGKLRYSIIDLTGAEWKRVRGLQSPFFTSGKLKRNMECLKFCVNNLKSVLDKYDKNSEEFDPKKVTGAFTLEAIALTGFGLEIDSQNNPDHVLLDACQRILQIDKLTMFLLMLGFVVPSVMPLLDKMGVEAWPKGCIDVLTQVTRKAIEERQKSKQDRPDFIQAMIKAHEVELDNETKQELGDEIPDRGKGLTEDEIVAQVTLFMLAGYDTVSTATSFLMFTLANNPTWQDKVYQETQELFGDGDVTYDKLKQTTYLDMCFDETQRLYPSAFRAERKCVHDTTINGYFIPKDTLVIIPIYGLNHDPELWKDPENFDPERFSPENKKDIDPYMFQPFGVGPRSCLGMRLALIEVKMAIIVIVQNFKLTVSDKMQLPLQLDAGFYPKAKGGIWLKVQKRGNSC